MRLIKGLYVCFFCLIILAFSLNKTMAAHYFIRFLSKACTFVTLFYIQLYLMCYMQTDSPMTGPVPFNIRSFFLSAASRPQLPHTHPLNILFEPKKSSITAFYPVRRLQQRPKIFSPPPSFLPAYH